MEPFRIHILGCGSALPTLKHSASAQLIEMRGKCFMMDCGEGAQMQFRRSHVHFAKVSAIFISHLHGDHCFGLLGLLSTFGMLGRTSRLKVFAPECYASLFEQQMDFFMQGMTYEIEFVPVDTTLQKVVYEDHSVTVETVPLRHRVPCCGYIFRSRRSTISRTALTGRHPRATSCPTAGWWSQPTHPAVMPTAAIRAICPICMKE